jgi:hypothetical protein
MPKLRKPPNDPVEIVTDNPDEPIVIELDDAPSPEAEIEVVQKTRQAEPQEDGDDPVKKALEATQRAEDLQRSLAEANRRADEQARIARERDAELQQERGDRVDAEYNSVLTAIAAEQSTLEQAKAVYQQAAATGDWAAASEAQSVLAKAAARVDRLEDNKAAFDQKRESDKKAPPVQKTSERQPAQDFESQISNFPQEAKTWLRAHPDYWNDPAKNLQLQSLHGYLVHNKKIPQFSQDYFNEIDIQLGLTRAAPEPQRQTQRSMPVSAPVSRDVPGPSGQRTTNRITLSPEERDIARKSFTATDMTDEQKERLYAMNKQKLHKLRANGEYRHTTEQTG